MAKWIQKATKRMEEKGTKGSFTRWAHAHGFDSPKAAASHVMAHKDKYSSSIVKKANFAKNVSK
jgi:SOS-response transcriptional repressor LexA